LHASARIKASKTVNAFRFSLGFEARSWLFCKPCASYRLALREVKGIKGKRLHTTRTKRPVCYVVRRGRHEAGLTPTELIPTCASEMTERESPQHRQKQRVRVGWWWALLVNSKTLIRYSNMLQCV